MSIETLADIVREHALQRPGKVALTYVEDGRSWTYGALEAESNRVANALRASGVQAQERIAYTEPRRPPQTIAAKPITNIIATNILLYVISCSIH